MPKVVPSQIVAFIDEDFPFARLEQEYVVDRQFKAGVTALLRLVDELPDDLITLYGYEYNQFVRAIETLRSTLGLWEAHGQVGDLFHRELGRAISKLRRVLIFLPDESTPSRTSELEFIADGDLRESIRSDVAAADNAFAGQEWKAATVLAGAVVEALLLWAINERRDQVPQAIEGLRREQRLRPPMSQNPEDWTLEIYKLVAEQMQIISGNTVPMISLAQGFRNLIHPGKSLRTGERCSRSTAHNAFAAMTRLIEDFS